MGFVFDTLLDTAVDIGGFFTVTPLRFILTRRRRKGAFGYS